MKRRNYVPRKRQKYGFRKGCLRALFAGMADGEIRVWRRDEVNVASLRTRAAEMNRVAKWKKYVVSWDRLTDMVRVKRNIKEEIC